MLLLLLPSPSFWFWYSYRVLLLRRGRRGAFLNQLIYGPRWSLMCERATQNWLFFCEFVSCFSNIWSDKNHSTAFLYNAFLPATQEDRWHSDQSEGISDWCNDFLPWSRRYPRTLSLKRFPRNSSKYGSLWATTISWESRKASRALSCVFATANCEIKQEQL